MAKTDWASGDKLTAEAMNSLGTEVGKKAEKSDIPSVPAAPTADTLSGVTDTGKKVLKASDAAAARTAIGAGTGSSNLKVGTTATDAKAGNYVPDWGEVTGKPTTFPAAPPAWSEVTGKPTIPSISGLAKQSDLDAALARIKALEDANTTPAEG